MTDASLPPLLAGVELGGTKCICIIGTGPNDVRDQVRIATGEPDVTLAAIASVFDRWRSEGHAFAAIGIGSFGPLNLDRRSSGYGRIAATPKPGWRETDLVGRFARRYAVPIGFDTDVDAAALAEGRWGAAQGLDSLAYITVGTGVGVGIVTANRPVFGFSHSELGHIRINRARGDDWPGSCPYHGDCVEGLVSGSAIAARVGVSGSTLAADHPIWPLVAHGLGQLLHTIVLAAAPRRIVIGGGVMEAQPQLFDMVRRNLTQSINGYVALPEDQGLYVVPPGLGDRAGPLGTLALASAALR